ncbi:MAG: Rpn family recombination-promoting nuclease/putative transposase [Lachnospiraceae bacterium]|nr:Rpn family recombination-promoting nuclease/putative transposase [Lachnospiraceae bacterium]
MNPKTNASGIRRFRKLEELNLIDNFLFQEMLSHKEEGEEFVRILLSTILEKNIRKVKIIPQKNILGADTNLHGIRLDAYIEDVSDELDATAANAEVISDIYDIEPNNTYEKESLPKRMRYYHGLIDTQFLSAGTDYAKLPNVVIIVILPYDPFGKNRMMYTIKNSCIDDLSVPYDDGAKKIFLYTRGTAGNPSQKLSDMLKYIEKTTDNNVTDPDIKSIQQLVEKVKRKKEVGINHMKSWEIEKMVRDEGYAEGYEGGYDKGYDSGQDRVNLLIVKLNEAGRTDDIVKVALDKTYQESLFEEFDL